MEKLSELSVFFPAYNEEKNIKETVLRAAKILPKIASKYEIIIVDDGSTDKTGEIAERLAKEKEFVKVVHHRPNRGYGAALKSGFSESRYSWVAFTDADGQFDFSEIERFLPLTNKADLIWGYRLKRADSLIRRFGAFVWDFLAQVLFGLNVRDYSCGFKLIKKRVFEEVQPLTAEEKVTQIELLVKARRLGFKFAEVGVSHHPRKFGQQTGANIKVVARSFLDLFRLWQKIK